VEAAPRNGRQERAAKATVKVARGVWMRHHEANWVLLFPGCWAFVAVLIALAVPVELSHHSGLGAGLVASVTAAVSVLCALCTYRVLSTRVMVTDTEVVIRNIRRTVCVPIDQVLCFEKRSGRAVPRSLSSSIALVLNGGKRIELVAFEKFPSGDVVSWLRPLRPSTYWDDTIASLNELIGQREEPDPSGTSSNADAVKAVGSLAVLACVGRLFKREPRG
jgi:hypothetical protein